MREHVPLLIQKKQNFDYFFKEKKKNITNTGGEYGIQCPIEQYWCGYHYICN